MEDLENAGTLPTYKPTPYVLACNGCHTVRLLILTGGNLERSMPLTVFCDGCGKETEHNVRPDSPLQAIFQHPN